MFGPPCPRSLARDKTYVFATSQMRPTENSTHPAPPRSCSRATCFVPFLSVYSEARPLRANGLRHRHTGCLSQLSRFFEMRTVPCIYTGISLVKAKAPWLQSSGPDDRCIVEHGHIFSERHHQSKEADEVHGEFLLYHLESFFRSSSSAILTSDKRWRHVERSKPRGSVAKELDTMSRPREKDSDGGKGDILRKFRTVQKKDSKENVLQCFNEGDVEDHPDLKEEKKRKRWSDWQ